MTERPDAEMLDLKRELAAARVEVGALTQRLEEQGMVEHRRAADLGLELHDVLAALAASEARFRILVERSPDGLMTLAPPTWRITAANPAALAMFGVPTESALCELAPASLSPERQPDGRLSAKMAREMIERAARDGSHTFEWTHRRASGEEFPAAVALVRADLAGTPMVQAIVRDESEKRRVQASLAEGDRLASIGMLAAGVAHEINNPLVYVLANVETLAEELPKLSEVAAHLDLLEAAASALEGTRRIASIARGLSSFARVERLERTRVDLRRAIESAATMAFHEIKYRATLVEEHGELPLLWAAEGKLSQVFLNLLINAAHAMPEGDARSQRITVRTWADGDEVFAEVSDTGSGIAPEHLERIFEPFFTTKKAGKGSGLGLGICRALLAEIGGDLRVDSEVGRGTRVTVRLPAGRTDADLSSTVPPLRQQSMAPVTRGRVLVVDDEEHIRAVLRRTLRRAHDVVAVASGREAKALLEQDAAFDVVLCDLMMPEISGLALHAWLAARDPALAKRVVFISGGGFTPETSDYVARLDNRQLGKPFDLRELRGVVADMVAGA